MLAYLSLGSNIGDKKKHLERAIFLLQKNSQIVVLAESSIYKTEPVGLIDQDWFLNQCVKIETDLRPRELLEFCQEIEQKLGRKRTVRWGPRTIDIDILLYGDLVVSEADLQIPHPRMTERRFVLEPLNQLAGEVVHPVAEKTIRELLDKCRDRGKVICLNFKSQVSNKFQKPSSK